MSNLRGLLNKNSRGLLWALIFVVIFYLIVRNINVFGNIIVVLLGFGAVVLFHEFGHAYTAKKYGCHVNSMGMVLMFFWPILYTDTTDAWQLTERKQRLGIDAAGMLTELAIATFASITWFFLPAGP